jgi:hypothetical protein
MTDNEIITTVHAEYPGYDKYLHSKVNHPAKYGVCRIPEAEKLLSDTTPCAPRREDKHRAKCSARCRMSKTKLGRLQQAFKRSGYTTIQSGMEALTNYYLDNPDMLKEQR